MPLCRGRRRDDLLNQRRWSLKLRKSMPQKRNSSRQAIARAVIVFSPGDRTSIELCSGSFGEWTKALVAIAQALVG